MKAVLSIANRFKEPSSWAGLSGIAAMLGVSAPSPVIQSISFVGAGICGLIAFFVPESK